MPSTKYNFRISPEVAIAIDADNQAEAFKAWAAAHEIFGFVECPACHSDVYPRVRVIQDNSFPEIVCTNSACGRALSLGQKKKPAGTLFPKRKAKDGTYLEYDGFVLWKGTPRDDDAGDDEEVATSRFRVR